MNDVPIGQQLQAIEWQSLPPQELVALVSSFTRKIEASIAAQHREPDLWEIVCLRRASAAISAGQIKSALSGLEAALRRPVFGTAIEGELSSQAS
jgi:hypothetical protein